MSRIHTLSNISEGQKLGDIPSNRYPPSRTELENQLVCANQDREIAIECGNRLANKCSVLDKDNKRIQRDLKQSNKDKKKLSKHAYQLIEEVKRLKPSSEICTEVSNTEISKVEDPLQYNKDSATSPNETYSQISMGRWKRFLLL
ncbi:3921_t:CDS:2 [Gigaspora margarita]|uniref:3921_t:CDS:1 n=1 Tax=Gigaspora margarita TaxID=4874 RepID=A0ABN7VYZ5_GIGMA|nr:3921_t:CDS:2 [Gigaspora margarita]